MGYQLKVQRRDEILQLILNKPDFKETNEYRFNRVIKYFKHFKLQKREIDDLEYISLAFIEKLIMYFNHEEIKKYLKALLSLIHEQIDITILRSMGEHLLINLNDKVHDLVKEQLWKFYVQMLHIATTQKIHPKTVYSLDEMTLIKFMDHIQLCENMLLQKLELQILHSMFPMTVQNLTSTLKSFFPENSALQYAFSAFIKNPFKTSWRGFMNCLNMQRVGEIFFLQTLFITILGKQYGLNKEDERTYVDFNCSKYTITFNILTENILKPVSISIQNSNIESIFSENLSSLNAAEIIVTFKNTINVNLLNHSNINYIGFRFNTKHLQDIGINKKDSFLYMFFGKIKVFRDATQYSLSQLSQDIIFSTPSQKQKNTSRCKRNKIKVLSDILISKRNDAVSATFSNNSMLKQLENNGEIDLLVENEDSCDSENLLTYLLNESMLLVNDHAKNSETQAKDSLSSDVHTSYSRFEGADSSKFQKALIFDINSAAVGKTSGWFSKENNALSNFITNAGNEFLTNPVNFEVSELNPVQTLTKTTESFYHTAECHIDNREVDMSTTTAPARWHSASCADLVNKSSTVYQKKQCRYPNKSLTENVDKDIAKFTINNAKSATHSNSSIRNNKLCVTLEEEFNLDKEVNLEVGRANESRQLLQNNFLSIDTGNVEHASKMESIQEYLDYYMDSELSSPDIPCEVISLPVFSVNCAKNYDVPCIEIEIIPSWITCSIDNTNQMVISKSQKTKSKFKLKRNHFGNDIEKISISRTYKKILKNKPTKHEEVLTTRSKKVSFKSAQESVRKLVLADIKKRKCVVELKKIDIFKMERELKLKKLKESKNQGLLIDTRQLRTVFEEKNEWENRIVRQESLPPNEPLNNLSTSELQMRSAAMKDVSVVLHKSTKEKTPKHSTVMQQKPAKRNVFTKYKQKNSLRAPALYTLAESDGSDYQDREVPNATSITPVSMELCTILEKINNLEDSIVRQESPPQTEPLNLSTTALRSRWKSTEDVSVVLDVITNEKRMSKRSKNFQQKSIQINDRTKHEQIGSSQMLALHTLTESSDGNEEYDLDSLYKTRKKKKASERWKVKQQLPEKRNVSTKYKQILTSRMLTENTPTETSDDHEELSSIYSAIPRKQVSSLVDKSSKQAEHLSRRNATLKKMNWIRRYINMHSVKRHKTARRLRPEIAEQFLETLDKYKAEIGYA